MDTSNSFTNNMETVEEEIKRMRESLVELDFKSEKAVVVESLTAEVHQMTEDKARQEEKTAAELERLAGKIAELNEAATARLADVDIYSQGVNTKIEELENTVEDRLAALADKTKGELDSRMVEVEGRLAEKTEENKLIVQKFQDQQDSIEKIFTDISDHSGVLEEMLVLKVKYFPITREITLLIPRRPRWPGLTVLARMWRRRLGNCPVSSAVLT